MSRGQALFSPQEIANMIKVWSELQSDLANCLESFVKGSAPQQSLTLVTGRWNWAAQKSAHLLNWYQGPWNQGEFSCTGAWSLVWLQQEHSHCEALRSSLNDAEVELNLAQKAYSKRAKPETKEALQKVRLIHAPIGV